MHLEAPSLLPSFHPSAWPQPSLWVPAALFSPTHCQPSPIYPFFSVIFSQVYTVMSILFTPSALSSLFLFFHLVILPPIFMSQLQSSCSGSHHIPHSLFFSMPHPSIPPPHLVILRSCCRVLASAPSSRHSCWWHGKTIQTCKTHKRFNKLEIRHDSITVT